MDEILILFLLPWLLLVFIKLYALTLHNLLHNMCYGVKISQNFLHKKKDEGIKSALAYLSEERYKTSRVFQMLYKKCSFRPLQLLFSFLYKWPVMLSTAAALLFYFSWLNFFSTSIVLSIVCILLIIIEVANEIIGRLALGNADNFRRYVVMDPTELNSLDTVFYDHNKILRDFTTTILVQLTCITLAFSSLYFCVSRFDPKAFNQPLNNPIDAVYFAVVVGGTIGFGDFVPTSVLCKTLLICNVGIVMLFVVFIVGHFFASLSDTPDNIIKPGR